MATTESEKKVHLIDDLIATILNIRSESINVSSINVSSTFDDDDLLESRKSENQLT